MSPTFAQLGVPKPIGHALARHGITQPFEIQTATLPDAMKGRDVCGRAPTGSGKTLAFGIPLVVRVGRAEPRKPKALVLAPTRELADQIMSDIRSFSGKVRVAVVYGGVGYGPQIRAFPQRCRHTGGVPGAPRRPDPTRRRPPLRGRDHRRRRGRPHGRYGVHPRRPAPPRPDRDEAADDVVLRHAGQRRCLTHPRTTSTALYGTSRTGDSRRRRCGPCVLERGQDEPYRGQCPHDRCRGAHDRLLPYPPWL